MYKYHEYLQIPLIDQLNLVQKQSNFQKMTVKKES